MVTAAAVIIVFVLIVFLFMQQSSFGRTPRGQRLELIRSSPNYKNGSFQNESHTPSFTEGATFFSVLKEFLFKKKENKRPSKPLPSFKTDLHSLPINEDVLIWMGHSSYFMQVDGKRILVDPVLSGSASPFIGGTKSFSGTDIYGTNDIPEIDFLFISHDHWDHLDHKVIKAIRPRIKKIITGLGTAEHLERWGFSNDIIIERDWYQSAALAAGFDVTVTPARHFSGRGFARNKALWVSFVLHTPNKKIYIGGDSGYDNHFKTIGKDHGPFDLVVLECGQYNKNWKFIHMMPEEVVQAAKDLQARRLLAVHWGKFMLSDHTWKDPIERVSKAVKENNVLLFTPMIGEKIDINASENTFQSWWENID